MWSKTWLRIGTDLFFRARCRCKCILPTSLERGRSKIDPVHSGVLQRRRRRSRMILNNAKYEAEKDVGNAKRGKGKRSTIRRGARRSENEESGRNTEGEGYIGYADRRKGTSWWNNRSLARAIASGPALCKGCTAGQVGSMETDECWPARVMQESSGSLFLSLRGSHRKAKSARLLILCLVSTTLRYVPVCNWNLAAAFAIVARFLVRSSFFLGRSSYWNRIDPLSPWPFADVAFGFVIGIENSKGLSFGYIWDCYHIWPLIRANSQFTTWIITERSEI